MPLSVVCPGCGRKLKAPDKAVGKKVKCPKCRQQLTIPGTAERAKPTPKSARLPNWMTPPKANAEDTAAAKPLEGVQPQRTASPTNRHATEDPFDYLQQGSEWEAPRDLRHSAQDRMPAAPRVVSRRLLLLGVCGVAAVVLLAAGSWIYSNRMAADNDRQAKQAVAQRQADEEQMRNAQLAATQKLAQQQVELERQLRVEQERGRNEASRIASQLGQERQEIEEAKAALESERETQAEQERARQELAKRQAVQEDKAALAAFLAQRQQLSDEAEGRIKEYLLTSRGDRDPSVRNASFTARELNNLHDAFKSNDIEGMRQSMSEMSSPRLIKAAIRLIDIGGDYIPPSTPKMETWKDAWKAGLKLVKTS